MRSVLRTSEGTLEAADGVFATPDGDAFPKDVGLSRFYRLRTLRCGSAVTHVWWEAWPCRGPSHGVA